MRENDIIVIGELNVDLLLNKIEKFPSMGKEVLADQMKMALGSSSAIFASNISTLGTRVGFLGKIGVDDFGNFIIKTLEDKNIETSLIKRETQRSTGLTVVMNYNEDRAMVTYLGAISSLTFDDIHFNYLSNAKHLHFSSYFLQKGINKDLIHIFKQAKNMDLTVSFDPQWDPDENWEIDLSSILPFVDVFFPNEIELMYLTGTNNLENSVKKLENISNVIAIKAGNKGSYLYHKGDLIHFKPFLNENVVDAIGAGDSFNAGFIYKYINGYSIEQCQQFANLIGAISTTASGGTAAFTDKHSVIRTANDLFGFTDF